jgi:hypothetical protein
VSGIYLYFHQKGLSVQQSIKVKSTLCFKIPILALASLNLTPNGTAPADYLGAQVEGGGHSLKPYEWGLNVGTIWQRFKSRTFGAGFKWLPGSGATTDAHGNITKGYARL